MKTVELSGTLSIEWDDNTHYKLIQENGLKIDLVNRLSEISESFPNSEVQLNYYLSDSPKTKDEMIEGLLGKIYGSIESEYTQEDYNYSSWTNGTDYYTTMKVGGHDLENELSDKEGKFILIELNFK